MRIRSNAILCIPNVVLKMLFLLCCGFLMASCDVRVPLERELSRYPELKPFLAGYQQGGYKGGKHDLDTGYYSFSFVTSHTMIDFFRETDPAAATEGWSLVDASRNKRVYLRSSKIYPAANFNDKVTLVYGDEPGWVALVNERDYSSR